MVSLFRVACDLGERYCAIAEAQDRLHVLILRKVDRRRAFLIRLNFNDFHDFYASSLGRSFLDLVVVLLIGALSAKCSIKTAFAVCGSGVVVGCSHLRHKQIGRSPWRPHTRPRAHWSTQWPVL